MNIGKILWMTLGFAGLILGAVGALLPMIPTVPFLLLAALGFGKSSKRLHKWFVGTKLYKNNLESYVKGQGMTRRVKIKITLTVTLLMAFGFFMMLRKDLYIPCAVLGGVWLLHIVYFACGVKTRRPENSSAGEQSET